MKILSAGDLHGDAGIAKKLAQKAAKEGVDIVILCGDLTEADEKTDNLIGPFLKYKKKVLVVPGNHEGLATVDFLEQLYGIKNLHGYSMRFIEPSTKGAQGKSQSIGIFGCSAVNVGIHQITDRETYDLLKKGHDYIKDTGVKIMVTHVHPADSKMEKFTNFIPGSKAVRRAIDTFKPDILLCSHVHEAEGLEEKIGKTRVINVGQRGKIFEI